MCALVAAPESALARSEYVNTLPTICTAAVPVGFEAGLTPPGKFEVGSFALDKDALKVLVSLPPPPHAYATSDISIRNVRLMLGSPRMSPVPVRVALRFPPEWPRAGLRDSRSRPNA